MPLEHLELFPVLETDDIVRLYRRTDRNGWFLLHRRLFGGLAERGERPVDVLDDQRQVGNRDAVVADMGSDKLLCQRNQCLVHFGIDSNFVTFDPYSLSLANRHHDYYRPNR